MIGATRNFQSVFGSHPRLVYGERFPATSPDSAFKAGADQNQDFITDARGSRPRRHRLSALHFWSRSAGTPSNTGPSSMVQDAGASGGWAIKLQNGAASGGLAMHLVLGRELMPGDRIRIRLKNTGSNGWYNFISDETGGQPSYPLPRSGA